MDTQTRASLATLLTRLDRTLSSQPQKHITPYDRTRIRANLDHARTLLLTLEKQITGIRIASQRTQAQKELVSYREHVKGLGDTLKGLEHEEQEDDDEDSYESKEEDDDSKEEDDDSTRVREYAPARSDANAGLDVGDSAAAQLQNELRARKPLSAEDNRSTALTSARETLFANRSPKPSSDANTSTTETLLSHNRSEQEALTNGLLGLARALKESSHQFGVALESEKEVLARAEGGLEKSGIGMEAAERRMGMLRRMSEGQGWWGRIKLYAFIAGLWLVAFLLVFLGPKLRF